MKVWLFRKRGWLLAAVLVVCALTGLVNTTALRAQQQGQQPPDPNDQSRIVLDVTRVNILYTVTDKKGRFVTDLSKDDFQVYEGKKQQTIQQFTAESDLPLRIAILVDTSNSIRQQMNFEQQAAIRFVQSVLRNKDDRVMLVSFDSVAELITDLTNDMPTIEGGIKGLRSGGGTSMYDAVYFACKEKLMKDQPRDKFRRAMVILSDGEDTASKYTRDQALEMAQKSDTVVYAISTNTTRDDKDGDKILRYFAEETGGQAFFPFKIEDLDQSFENIANELRHQYNIFFRPEPLKTDGLFHQVNVKVKSRPGLLVRARKGYYAPRS